MPDEPHVFKCPRCGQLHGTPPCPDLRTYTPPEKVCESCTTRFWIDKPGRYLREDGRWVDVLAIGRPNQSCPVIGIDSLGDVDQWTQSGRHPNSYRAISDGPISLIAVWEEIVHLHNWGLDRLNPHCVDCGTHGVNRSDKKVWSPKSCRVWC